MKLKNLFAMTLAVLCVVACSKEDNPKTPEQEAAEAIDRQIRAIQEAPVHEAMLRYRAVDHFRDISKDRIYEEVEDEFSHIIKITPTGAEWKRWQHFT